MAKRRRLNACVHDGWIHVNENTWWKTISNPVCKTCQEQTIVFQNSNCYRCRNKIEEKRNCFGNYGYYFRKHIYCNNCKQLLELNCNVAIKLINDELLL